MVIRNVLGGELELCSLDPVTGCFRDGFCNVGSENHGHHTICAVLTKEFLEYEQSIGNDLITPRSEDRFPGLEAGDRWCITAEDWLRSYQSGAAPFVVLAATNEHVLELVPLETLREHSVDVPTGPEDLHH